MNVLQRLRRIFGSTLGVVLVFYGLLVVPAFFAKAQGKDNPEESTPFDYDNVAYRIFFYKGKTVLVKGLVQAVTKYNNGTVLTIIAKGRRVVYVRCDTSAPSFTPNQQVELVARVPSTATITYLEYLRSDTDAGGGDNARKNLDLTRVRFDEAGEAAMLELVNQERTKAGLRPYVMNEKLREAARKHSADMVLNGYFSHQSQDGTTVSGRVSEEGISYGGVGENIASGDTVATTHRGLMESPGHRQNIMSKDFTDIGIGIAKNSHGGIVVTQNFIYRH